jgi:hypothetical protein
VKGQGAPVRAACQRSFCLLRNFTLASRPASLWTQPLLSLQGTVLSSTITLKPDRKAAHWPACVLSET